MQFNRRGFLAALISGSTVASAMGAAGATPVEMNRYQKVIDYQTTLIEAAALRNEAHETVKQSRYREHIITGNSGNQHVYKGYDGDPDPILKASYDRISEHSTNIACTVGDELLDYLTNHFAGGAINYTPETRQNVRDMFDRKIQIDTLSEEDMVKYEDAVVSIAIMKNLISIHNVPFNTRRMQNFSPWVRVFRDLIMS